MKVLKIDLPRELDQIELHVFADEHIGDECCDLMRLYQRIEYVRDTPGAYCILNGDIIDNATRTSVGDVYTQEFNPMEQLRRAVELFEPIKDKILLITHGNHENRTYKHEGINLSSLLASQLGLSAKYTPTSAVMFIRFGEEARGRKETNGSGKYRMICYTVYVLHGTGGGRKEGAKANRLVELASIIDADIYIHSHVHTPMIIKQGFHRIDAKNSTVAIVDKLFVNTAANLNYGGYGEAGAFKPSSKETPVIYLDGTRKNYKARL